MVQLEESKVLKKKDEMSLRQKQKSGLAIAAARMSSKAREMTIMHSHVATMFNPLNIGENIYMYNM